MGEFVVRGGRRLAGAVRINGAKNAALPIMAASLLSKRPVIVRDVPEIRDVAVMVEVLRALGVKVEREGSTVVIDAALIKECRVPDALMQEMRASVFVMGPLLARLGRTEIVHPGGCAIGDRPIDLHLKGFEALGAEVRDERQGTVVLANRLVGAEIHLAFPSVGATENLIMAAALAEGETRIRNAAMEPEVVDLAQFLSRMGVMVRGAGTPELRVVGCPALGAADHTVIPDRIETATFALAVASAGGAVRLLNCVPDHLPGLWQQLRDLGVEVKCEGDQVAITAAHAYAPHSVTVNTGPYPGFATDIQAQFMAFLLKVPGIHLVSERVFENRLGHVTEFRRLGAHIIADQRLAVVYGGQHLYGASVSAKDLRAGAALVVAGLQIEGSTRIAHREVIERGYHDLDGRLRSIGADIISA